MVKNAGVKSAARDTAGRVEAEEKKIEGMDKEIDELVYRLCRLTKGIGAVGGGFGSWKHRGTIPCPP